DGLLPHGQPQAVTERRQEVHGRCPLLATAASGFAVYGHGLRLACGRGESREDTFRPSAQCSLHQGHVQLAQDMVQGSGAGGLVMRKAQGTCPLLAITTAPVGYCAVTPVTTQHSDTHE